MPTFIFPSQTPHFALHLSVITRVSFFSLQRFDSEKAGDREVIISLFVETFFVFGF